MAFEQPRAPRRSGWSRSRRILARALPVAIFASLLAVNFTSLQSARAAGSQGVGQAVTGQLTKTSSGTNFTASSAKVTASNNLQYVLSKQGLPDKDIRGGATAAAQQNARSEAGAPVVLGTPVTAGSGAGGVPNTTTNFAGANAFQSGLVNGFDLEPPDQGLCVSSVQVVDIINLVAVFYDRSGNPVAGPVNLNNLFRENPADFLSDPRCYYDGTTNTWFFSILDIEAGTGRSHQDLAAVNGANAAFSFSFAIYRFDTTDDGLNGTPSDPGCPCFGDQPLLGVDKYGVYMSTNEFGLNTSAFNGAQIYAIDKAALVALAPSPNFVHYQNLTHPAQGGVGTQPAFSVQPAITRGDSAGAEYFMDSLDFNGTFDNRISVYALTQQSLLHTGGIPTLTDTVITSETYGQPPVAPQKAGPAPLADLFGSPIGALNTDDDRMQQVVYSGGSLWSSLTTVIHVSGDPDTLNVSGAAWFNVRASVDGSGNVSAGVLHQGYQAVSGNYELYPAIAVDGHGQAKMVVTLDGPSYYPTAAYSVFNVGSYKFGDLAQAGGGAGPEDGFTCLNFISDLCRWGDYSAAVTDPSDGSVWMATEDINQTCTDAQFNADPFCGGTRDPFANWATQVFQVPQRS